MQKRNRWNEWLISIADEMREEREGGTAIPTRPLL